LRERYRQHGILCVNLISARGSGKTTLLERTFGQMGKTARLVVLTLLTKIDLLPYVPFNAEKARENARRVHPQLEIISLSNTTGEGLDRWMD
jgi:Ni2+-binding GTPase involved in maturation of urease and hydrogenase